jgi:hypothetical protein
MPAVVSSVASIRLHLEGDMVILTLENIDGVVKCIASVLWVCS